MTGIELLERGVSKDSLALLAIPLTPLEIFLPLFIAKYTTRQKTIEYIYEIASIQVNSGNITKFSGLHWVRVILSLSLSLSLY